MVYMAPDYEKVIIDVSSAFAATYGTTGCPEDESYEWSYTVPCEGTDSWQQVHTTYTGLGMSHQCYSTLNK